MSKYGRSRKILKKILQFLVIAALIFSIPVLLFSFSSDQQRRELFLHLLETDTGSTVELGEPFHLALGRTVNLELHDLRIGQTGGESAPFYSAKRVRVQFPLLPLLLHRQLLLTLELEQVRVRTGPGENTGPLPVAVVPVDVHLEDLQVTLRGPEPAGREQQLVLDRFVLGREGGQRVVQLQGSYDGFPLELHSEVGDPLQPGSERRSLRVSGRLGRLEIVGKGWEEPWREASPPPLFLHLTGKAPTMRIFDGHLFARVPEGGPVEVEMDLDGRDGLSGRNIRLAVEGANARLKGQGEVASLLDGKGLRLQLSLESERPVAMLESWGLSAPAGSTKLEVSGRLTGEYARLSLEDLRIAAQGKDFELQAHGSLEELNRPRWLKAWLDGSGSAGGVPLELSLRLEGSGTKRLPLQFGIEGDGFELRNEGELEFAEQGLQVRVSMRGTARDLALAGRLLELKLNPVSPVTLESGIEYRAAQLKLRDFSFRAGQNDLGGHLEVRFGKGRPPRVTGEIVSQRLDMSELLPKGEAPRVELIEGEKADAQAVVEKQATERIFSDKLLKTAWLRQLEGKVDFRLRQLRARHYLLQGFSGRILMQDHGVTLEGVQAEIGGRPVTAAFTLRDTGKAATTHLKLDFDQADLARGFPGFGLPEDSGTISMHLDLRGEGLTYAEFAASLDGSLLVGLENSPFGFGLPNELGRSLLNRFNPEARKDPRRGRLECGAIYVEVDKGIATTPRGIAIRFPEVTWLGDAVVNLRQETLSAVLRPHPRKGLGLSLKGLADLVAVGGTLAQPAIVIDPSGTLLTTLSYTAALYTGGASLLIEGILERMKGEKDVCGYVLHGTESGTRGETRPRARKPERAPAAPAPGGKKPAQDLLDSLEHL